MRIGGDKRSTSIFQVAMNTTTSSWYIRGEGNKPLGPFAAEKLIESWHTRRLDPNTLCWQEGMAQWLPLAVVEPFASTVRAHRWSARLRILRLAAAGLLLIVVLAAIAGIGYFWWTESAMVARAEQLIAAGIRTAAPSDAGRRGPGRGRRSQRAARRRRAAWNCLRSALSRRSSTRYSRIASGWLCFQTSGSRRW